MQFVGVFLEILKCEIACTTKDPWGGPDLSTVTTTNDHTTVVLKAATYLKVLIFNKVEDDKKQMTSFDSFVSAVDVFLHLLFGVFRME